jgi:hypothetical protein
MKKTIYQLAEEEQKRRNIMLNLMINNQRMMINPPYEFSIIEKDTSFDILRKNVTS